MKTTQERIVDKLHVLCHESEDVMGMHAAMHIASCLEDLLSKQPEVNMVFAPAVSQLSVYEYLFKRTDIEWNRVNGFHLDEYMGLTNNHPSAISTFAHKHIASKAPFKAFYFMNTESTQDIESKRYEALLKEHPLDIAVIGIGTNAHLAYNEPHMADFNDPLWVRPVMIDAVSVKQASYYDKTFNEAKEVKTQAITMTLPAILSAKHLFVSVPGLHKATAVFNTLNGPIEPKVPSSILRKHDHAMLFLDHLASSLL